MQLLKLTFLLLAVLIICSLSSPVPTRKAGTATISRPYSPPRAPVVKKHKNGPTLAIVRPGQTGSNKKNRPKPQKRPTPAAQPNKTTPQPQPGKKTQQQNVQQGGGAWLQPTMPTPRLTPSTPRLGPSTGSGQQAPVDLTGGKRPGLKAMPVWREGEQPAPAPTPVPSPAPGIPRPDSPTLGTF